MINKLLEFFKQVWRKNEVMEDLEYLKDCENKISEVQEELQSILEGAGLERKDGESEEEYMKRLVHLYAFKKIIITNEYIMIKDNNMTFKKLR